MKNYHKYRTTSEKYNKKIDQDMELPGTPDVPLRLKRGLEMNDETSLTFLYKKHVPLEQVPESSKKKASKSEKNPEKKPEEEPAKKNRGRA